MGNLCSIYHAHFDKLFELTKSHNKAVFLDKCIFWWQISTYKLSDNKIWFTRKLSEISQELCLSERTINRYLADFEELGLIERKCKLSASNKNNEFTVTKRLYIRVTDKLLNFLTEKSVSTRKTNDCSFLEQNVVIEKDNLSESIYKENNYKNKINNTVKSLKSINKKTSVININEANYPVYPVEKLIGERIDERTKRYVKGMMFNVQKQHQVKISAPEQLFAEIIFAITNEKQFKKIDNNFHKVQVVAKLLRNKRWCTPNGFYKYCDYAGEKLNIPKDNYQVNQIIKNNLSKVSEIDLQINLETRFLEKTKIRQSRGEGNLTYLLESIQQKIERLNIDKTKIINEIRIVENRKICIGAP